MKKRILLLLLLAYTLFLFYLMIFGFNRTPYVVYRYNLEPFSTISYFFRPDTKLRLWLINILGNIVVFIPFGLLLPAYFKKLKISVLVFISGLFFLEALQYFTKRGYFDVDDFILNLLGFLLGYGIYSCLGKRKPCE
jgi:glycopeptide antibiotics resistance protein